MWIRFNLAAAGSTAPDAVQVNMYLRRGGGFRENLVLCSRSRVGGATGGDWGRMKPTGWNLCAQVPGGTLPSGVSPMAQPRYHVPEPQRVRRIAGAFA